MAEPLNERDIKSLLEGAREHYVDSPKPEAVEDVPAESGRQRMYRGQPVTEKSARSASGRQRSYRGQPVRGGSRNRGQRTNTATSLTDKLRQLQQLRDSGVIDEAEFTRLKKALLE